MATYERVSSEDQRERDTIKTQTEALARELERRTDVELVARYVDNGISGTVPMRERPEGRRLLDDAAAGRFDELWVYDSTRLARNTADATQIRDTLERHGVAVSWDGRVIDPFVYDVHAALAAEERRRFRRRSLDGMNRAASEGRYVGGIAPYGYRVRGLKEKARLVVDDRVVWADWSAADVVRHIYRRLASDHWSCIQVAEELNALGVPTSYARADRGVRGKRTAGIWRASRIRNLVVSTTYRGEFQYGKRSARRRDIITARVPRVVSDEEWEAAQITLHDNLLGAAKTPNVYLLRSLMKCGICGLTYVGTRARDTWYRCGGQIAQRGKYEGRCPGKGVKGEHLEPIVWADIEAWLRNPGELLEELRTETNGDEAAAVLEASRMTLQAAITSLMDRRTRRLSQHERGLISNAELDAALAEIDREQAEVESRLTALAPGEPRVPVVAESLVQELRDRLDAGLSEEDRREIVRHLVSRITVQTQIEDDGSKRATAIVEYRFPACNDDATSPAGDEEAACCSTFPHGCPCGYYGDSVRACTCPEASVSRYQRRVSGPLMDRIDLFADVPRVELKELTGEPSGERSEVVRARVVEARERQARRFKGTRILTNSEMGPNEVRKFCQDALVPEAQ
ncbi:MAG: recombinase family protein, partial [Dehalococcoidia bacterium]|nr:recombinase family protein [Dehalococcoidia bacterium]